MDKEISQLASLKKDLSNDERMQFDMQMASQRKNPTTALILSLFLGWLGIDRFYVGHTVFGFLKLLTLGGLLIWAILDLLLIMGVTRRQNVKLAKSIHDSLTQMR